MAEICLIFEKNLNFKMAAQNEPNFALFYNTSSDLDFLTDELLLKWTF